MIPGGLSNLFMGAAAKAFPTVAATNSGGDAAVNNSKTVTLPGGINAGDIILLGLGFYSDSGVTGNVPSGYTGLSSQQSGRTHFRTVYKVAAGTEGGTNVTVTANLNHFLGWTVQVIRGASSISVSSGATAASGAPDCPSHSPSWGADSTLFIALADAYGLTQAQSAPSGYSGYIAGASNSGGVDWGRVSAAWKQSSSGTEDPPAYPNAIGTGVTSPVWYGVTVSAQPAG